MGKSLEMRLPADATPVVRRIAEVGKRQIAERCGIASGTPGQADTVVTLAISPGVGPEGLEIAGAGAAWRWRVLYLRALVDCDLARSEGVVGERCEEAFEELAWI